MKKFLEYLNEKGKIQEPKVEPKTTDIKNVKQPKPVSSRSKDEKMPPKVEYIDNQGDLVEKPPVDVKADYRGKQVKSPEGKNASPYKAANDDVKSPTFDVEKNGLGDLGDSKLKYEPDMDTSKNQKTIKSWAKTESFLNKTKNMSLSEFTKYMLDECGCGSVSDDELPYVTAYTAGKFQPHPPEAIKYVVVLANKNNNILDNVVREMKNSGALGSLLKAILAHPEAYDELTNLFGDEKEGYGRCKLFAKSMNSSLEDFIKHQDSMYESVSSPIGFGDMTGMEDEDMGEEEDMEDENMEDEDMGDEEDMEDEDMGEEEDYDMEDEDMGEEEDYDMGDEDMGEEEDMGDEDMGEEEDMGDEDMGEEEDMEDEGDMGDEDMGDEEDYDMEDEDEKDYNMKNKNMDQVKEIDPTKFKRLKKKFAHNNLLNAMRDFNSIKSSID